MIHHSELLNLLAERFKLKSYLEIGTFSRDHNFNKINVANKVCVDPDPKAKADYECTSDFFFARVGPLGVGGFRKTFDLIFIDGLHHADQVKKDFENALKCLTPNGFIVLHDCNPPTEKTTCVPRGAQREWCGNTYQFACRLSEYDDISYYTVDFDYGCAVVWRNPGHKGKPIEQEITWDYFDKNREALLKLRKPMIFEEADTFVS